MMLLFLSPFLGSIYRVRIRNVATKEYLLRRDSDVGLTRNPTDSKTDFFIDLPDTRGNIKEVFLFEHVVHKDARYLKYEKGTNRLVFKGSPSKFRLVYNKHVFNIQSGNECLEVDKGIFLKKCDQNIKNQQFTLQVLKKNSHTNKNRKNSTMEVEVEGRDKKYKDKNIHRDDIYLKYDDESSVSSTDEDIINRFEDGRLTDNIVDVPVKDGNYKVTREVKKDVLEEPALLMKEHVSNIIHSTLYTTMIVNSTETVYTTVTTTTTSSVIGKQTEVMVLDPKMSDLQVSNDEEVSSIAQIRPVKEQVVKEQVVKEQAVKEQGVKEQGVKEQGVKEKWYKKPKKLFNWKTNTKNNDFINTKNNDEKFILKKVEDINTDQDFEEYCRNSNRPECRDVKSKSSINSSYEFTDFIDQADITDFIKAIPDGDLMDFIGDRKKTQSNQGSQLISQHPVQHNVHQGNQPDSLYHKQPDSLYHKQPQNNPPSFNSPYLGNTNYYQGNTKSYQGNVQSPHFKKSPTIKEEPVSQSGGLLKYVGLKNSLGEGFDDSSEESLFSGIHLGI